MKQNQWGPHAIAVAIAVVGALALGVPVGTLAIPGIALACPLMMFFMMRGMWLCSRRRVLAQLP